MLNLRLWTFLQFCLRSAQARRISDAAPSLEMVIGDSLSLLDERSGWRVFANPSVSLPKTTATGTVTICRKWSDFKIPAWMKDAPEYWTSDVGAKAAKQLVALKFLISAMPGEYKFNIKNLGTNPGQTSSSSSVAVIGRKIRPTA